MPNWFYLRKYASLGFRITLALVASFAANFLGKNQSPGYEASARAFQVITWM
jgi:hypothetical protein